jgi:hypothetical protein
MHSCMFLLIAMSLVTFQAGEGKIRHQAKLGKISIGSNNLYLLNLRYNAITY